MPAGVNVADLKYLQPELVLTAGSLLVLVLDVLLRRNQRTVLAWVSLATLAATFIVMLGVPPMPDLWRDHREIANGLIAIDRFAYFFKLIFLIAAAVTVLMSVRYLQVEGASAGEYYFLVLCATLGMFFMAGGIDLITIFIGLETMAVSFYILAGFLKPSQRSNEAAVKYYLLGAFSLGILLYGMSLLYGLTGTTNLRPIAVALAGHESDPRLVLAVILIVAGIGFKIAAVPFHMWAPDVYEGAPTPITAFLSVGSKAASFAMLLRIFFEALPSMSGDWRVLFEALSIVTMTVGNIAALTQTNIKRMLAYSSIAHAGYLLIGIVAGGAGSTRGISAALIYLMIYSFMQLGAFAVVVMLRREQVIGDELKDLSGLNIRHPFAAFAMLIFMLSLGGIPPTAGFMGKFWLFSAAIETHYYWLAVIGVVNSAISLYYYVRVVVFMYIKREEVGPVPYAGPALKVALAVSLIATLVLGLYPRALFEMAEASARTLGVAAFTASVR